MASCPPSAAVVEGSNEDLDEKVTFETFETIKEDQMTQWLKAWNTSSKFLEVLQGSIEIDRNKACKVVKMIEDEYGVDGLEKMSEAAFLEKAKFILKHKIDSQPPFCSYCLKTFVNIKDRNNHVKMLHENSVMKAKACPFCKKTFMCKTSLKYHVKVSHSASGNEVKCKLCDTTFRHALSLKRHIKSIHSEDSEKYQCEDCDKIFRRNDYLTVHRRIVHKTVKVSVDMVNTLQEEDGSFKCKICGEVFKGDNADDDIIEHIARKCKRKEQFLCGVCEKGFGSQFNLKRHQKIIHIEGPKNLFSCDYEQCQFITKHKANLVRHQKRKHDSN